MGGMTVCPKCKYDTKTADGGEKHKEWLAANRVPTEEEKAAAEAQISEEARKKNEAVSKILITSGFSFDGYTISRYVDCVSGNSVFHAYMIEDTLHKQDEEFDKALEQNRKIVLKKIKEAAADMDCNAIIGLRFDITTIDRWSINYMMGRNVEPGSHVICVSAYGSAVVIEKN